MEKYRFAFVSFSSDVASAVQLHSDPRYETVTPHLAAMENAVAVARQLLADGVDVIIGGGETGNLLVQTIGQPVVNMQRTYLDVIDALIEARKISKQVALTSFGRAMDGKDMLENLLGISIRQIIFATSRELESGIRQAIDAGYSTIVGGGICDEFATQYGGRAVTVMPRKQRIVDSLGEARAIASQRRIERRQFQEHRTILETIKEGVLVIDVQGRIKIINAGAARLLKVANGSSHSASLIGKPLPRRLHETGLLKVLKSGQAEIDAVRRVGGVDIVISCFPVTLDGETVGAAGIFKDTAEIQNIDRRVRETLYVKGFVSKHTFDDVLGESQAMEELRCRAASFAESDANVLIEGETGTGKEILANAIHAHSRRAGSPFVAVNCAALPEALLESELFGYEDGAFTGAKRGGKIGLFELANGGTLFLDEVGDVSPGLQVRLLRALEEREIMRVGGDRIVSVDVRVIGASHKSLSELAGHGTFRRDLYYRVATLKLTVPPLRKRPEDLALILGVLFAKHGLDPDAISSLMRDEIQIYTWPGNIRELDALVSRYVALKRNDSAVDNELFRKLFEELKWDSVEYDEETMLQPSGDRPLKEQVRAFERQVVVEALRQSGFRRKEAAAKLAISLNSLWRKMPKVEANQPYGGADSVSKS